MSRLAIFKDFKYLRILLLVAVLEIGANSYYYGIQFSLGNIGTNFGYNIILTGAIEFVAFFSTSTYTFIEISSSPKYHVNWARLYSTRFALVSACSSSSIWANCHRPSS